MGSGLGGRGVRFLTFCWGLTLFARLHRMRVQCDYVMHDFKLVYLRMLMSLLNEGIVRMLISLLNEGVVTTLPDSRCSHALLTLILYLCLISPCLVPQESLRNEGPKSPVQ